MALGPAAIHMSVAQDIMGSKRAEEALRKSEECWRCVFENSAIGVALTDPEGRFLATNPVYQKMLGYSEEELRALSFFDVTHEDYRESDRTLASVLLEGKRQQFQIEKQYRCKDGSLIWVRNNVSLVPGAGGMPRFLMTLSEDITERKKAEEALRQSEERATLILDSASEGIFGCDPHGTCLFSNPAAARLLGYEDPAELLGKNMHTLEHHTCKDGTPYPIEECPIYIGFQKGEGVHRDDEVYWRKDGTCFPVEFWSHPICRDGRTLGAVITWVDITERKRKEEALRKSEEQNRTLLEINNAIITNLSQEALLRSISEALRRVISFDRCAITLYRPEKGTFRFLAMEGGFVSDYFRPGLEIEAEGNSVGWVFHHQRPMIRRDLEKDQEYANERHLAAEGVRSHCVVPLIVRGKTIGTLNVASEDKNRYSEADADFLQEVAAQVALAIENMNAYEEIGSLNVRVERSAERLRTLLDINNAIITDLSQEGLLHAVAETLRRLIPFKAAAFTFYNPERDTFRVVTEGLRSDYFRDGLEFDQGRSVAGWVFEHRRPALRRDLEKEQQYPNDSRLVADGIKSHCVVPLIVRERCLGTLHVASEATNQYSEADAEFLQEVANQVALAVENTQSYEEIAALKSRLEKENIYLREEIRTEHNFEEIVGSSPALLAVLRAVEQVAPTDSTVLIYGETGTGKELIARAIHNRSRRKDRALVGVNCSAISAGLVESELFGHMKGAFTGALERRIGRFELADGGTIFLDEIGELPLETQVKLLRVLQEREFEPVGSSRPLRVDVRVIAATNRNLREAVEAGRFRSDLFYRLNVFPFEVPPLRERRSDIPQLVAFCISRFSQPLGKKIQGVSQESMDRLMSYSWPGNVRELQNVIERAVVLSAGPTLRLDEALVPIAAPGGTPEVRGMTAVETAPAGPLSSRLPTLEEVQRSHILAALQQSGGVLEGPKGAARILNLHPNTLRHRMNKLGIKRPRHRPS